MRKRIFPLSCLLLLLTGPLLAQPQPQVDLVAKAKSVLDGLVRGDFAGVEQGFDAKMKEVLSADKLGSVWKGLVAQVGPFQKLEGSRTATKDNYRLVFLTCAFEKARLDMQVAFDAEGKVGGLFFVPAASPAPAEPEASPSPPYAKKEAFRETEVTVGSGEWALPGTLATPVGPGPFPALVLVHGSGPNDRDETVGPNKPFRDLAWGLASRGIAVLRYEKRTKVYPEKIAALPRFTLQEESVDDALAAAALLRRSERIDPKRIYVLGHSLGGTAIPRIGKADPEIAGLIVLAGAARPPEEMIVEQLAYLSSLDGNAATVPKEALDAARKDAAKIKDLKEGSSEMLLGAPAFYWLDLRSHPSATAIREVRQPLLILQGERDYQVTLADFGMWKQALAGRKDVVFKSYPKLNHLFQEGTGKSTPQEYQQPGHVAPEVIDDIAAWILRR